MRFAIVGSGTIGRLHAVVLDQLDEAHLVGVTDIEGERARRLAEDTGSRALDLADVLSSSDIDAICVCTPSGLHGEIGERAARAGKHVLVEKPIDVTLKAADRLIAAAEHNGVTLAVVSQHRFDAGVARLHRALSQGHPGRPYYGAAVVRWWRETSYYEDAAWRGTLRLDGGTLLNQGIHHVDLLLWLLGPATRVFARHATAAYCVECEDLALVNVEFANGAIATVEVTTAAYPGFTERLTIVGERGTISIEGSEIAEWSLRDDDAQPTADDLQTPAGVVASSDPANLASESHRRQIADFIESARTGQPPAVSGKDGRRALELILAARVEPNRPAGGAGARGDARMISRSQDSAFGDEAAPELDLQLACVVEQRIGFLEFRSAQGRSVVAMGDGELHAVRRRLDAAGVRVSAIGSPVGKTKLRAGREVVEEQLTRSLAAAAILGTDLVRVFSFYVDDAERQGAFAEIVHCMGRMAAMAERAGVVLVHENEKGIYGDTPERCVALLEAVNCPMLAACFDVANFIQVGVTDVRKAWTLLAPRVRHVHVKDALPDGTVTPAGRGRGDRPYIIERLAVNGYSGFLTLEPHLDGVAPGGGCQRLCVAATAPRGLLGADVVAGAATP